MSEQRKLFEPGRQLAKSSSDRVWMRKRATPEERRRLIEAAVEAFRTQTADQGHGLCRGGG